MAGKRLFDLVLSAGLLVLALPVLLILAVAVPLDTPGPFIFAQKRVGRHNRLFTLYKIRTMRLGTPDLASHLIDPRQYYTRLGPFLRKSSLDELPNLWNVLRGDMSMVGPRPALYNQQDLIALRSAAGVDRFRPGLTGWAQVNGRDELSNAAKVGFDRWYCEHWGLKLDLQILWRTVAAVWRAAGIRG